MPNPTPELHPELARLEDRYNLLVDQVQVGELTLADATSALESLTVIDGRGAQWGLTVDGDFYRAYPGGTQEITDPVMFVPPQLPMRPDTPTSPPWAPGGPAGPAGPLPGGFRTPEPVISAPKSIHARPGRLAGVTSKLGGRVPTFGGGAGEWVRANVRSVIVGAVVVAILAVVVFTHGTSKPKTSTIPGGIPVSSTTVVGSGPGLTMPTTPLPTSGNPKVAMPAVGDAQRVISALGSGKRTLVASVVASAPTAKQLDWATALYSGAAKTGVQLASEGSPAMSGSTVVWTFELVDTATRQVVSTATTQWVQTGGVWKLAALPDFADPLAG